MSDDVTPQPLTIILAPAVVAEARSNGYLPDGSLDVFVWPADWCTGPVYGGVGCGKQINPDQPVRKVHGMWVHDDCARKAITTASVDEAWILLADQVAARPHTFRATEIRAIVQNVARIASAASRTPESGETTGDPR